MTVVNRTEIEEVAAFSEPADASPLVPLVLGRATKGTAGNSSSGAVMGELIGMDQAGRTPLVRYSGQPGSAAVPARSVIDLDETHVGRQVVLMFDEADGMPIIMGVLRESHGRPKQERPGQVEVDVDGERVIVSGERQIVLRCGKASITLTREGKVLIQGTYLSSHSSGVHRIKGGSVEIN